MVDLLAKLHSEDVFPTRNTFEIEMGHYVIKTASTHAEVLASLKLRHDVFYKEMIGTPHPSGLDVDRYDAFFDHLIIVDKKTKDVIATYRLYLSTWGDDFYTKSEFDLTNLSTMPGPFLEMGRACVHPNYRRGVVMTLLWRGIAEYMRLSDARVLMGCGSIKTENPEVAALLAANFKRQGVLAEPAYCTPIAAYDMPGYAEAFEKFTTESWNEQKQECADNQLPSLLKSYLKIGAIVAGPPAWDRDFKCIDFVVLLQKEKIGALYSKKYGVE